MRAEERIEILLEELVEYVPLPKLVAAVRYASRATSITRNEREHSVDLTRLSRELLKEDLTTDQSISKAIDVLRPMDGDKPDVVAR